ncbi:hypothetical protein [Modestobacter lapidis]|nr:hypothetical protein [Modestobacter lapidis]
MALVLAWAAWKRPYPTDPTQIPTWGFSDEEERTIDGPKDAMDFIGWIEANAGRKVRIQAFLGPYFDTANEGAAFETEETGFWTPVDECGDASLAELSRTFFTGPVDCPGMVQLRLDNVGPERPGMSRDSRGWQLNGYFADIGYLGMQMGQSVYSVTPLTAVEAVS